MINCILSFDKFLRANFIQLFPIKFVTCSDIQYFVGAVKMGGLPIESSSTISLKSHKDQVSSAVASEPDSKPKKKICCACPETKKLRDECIVENGEAACDKWIEAHRKCLRAEGFNVWKQFSSSTRLDGKIRWTFRNKLTRFGSSLESNYSGGLLLHTNLFFPSSEYYSSTGLWENTLHSWYIYIHIQLRSNKHCYFGMLTMSEFSMLNLWFSPEVSISNWFCWFHFYTLFILSFLLWLNISCVHVMVLAMLSVWSSTRYFVMTENVIKKADCTFQ